MGHQRARIDKTGEIEGFTIKLKLTIRRSAALFGGVGIFRQHKAIFICGADFNIGKNALSATTVAVSEPVKVPLVTTQDSGGQRAG